MTREDFIMNVKAEQKHLRVFLLGLCADPLLADDLAQETLMKAYLASSGYKPRFKFSTWLLKIAYNTYLDHQKLYHIRNRSPLDALPDRPGDKTPDSNFEYQKLYQALDTLVEKERTAVMLFYIYGFSVKEISGIMEESAQAVKKQLSRARSHLKTQLEEQ
ncbi:MAG: RNA polymerase sigma factor [Candidatus Cryptobacteroides sp.]